MRCENRNQSHLHLCAIAEFAPKMAAFLSLDGMSFSVYVHQGAIAIALRRLEWIVEQKSSFIPRKYLNSLREIVCAIFTVQIDSFHRLTWRIAQTGRQAHGILQ